MSRFACMLVPDVPLAAALRAEPELCGRPLAITDERGIIAGRLRGLTVAQARAIDPNLETRPFSLEGVRSAQEALVDVALSVSPRVEDAGPGLVFVDLEGTEALFPTPRGLLTALESRTDSVGLTPIALAIGPTCTTAHLAARHGAHGGEGQDREPPVVSERRAIEFLARLPLDLLDPPDDILERVSRWGLRTLGDLSRIARPALGSRLGEEGVRLARRARGEDLEPFRPTPPRLRFEESEEPGFPVGNLETLAFPLRGVLDRLAGRLRVRGLAVRELLLELELESGQTWARTVSAGAPTAEAATLTSLVRLALERDPPPESIEKIRAIATPGRVETAQLDLFLPPLPAPAELAVTLARLEALCGPGRVGAPGVADTHRPDAALVESFDTDPASGASIVHDGSDPLRAMALRALRPPSQVRVWTTTSDKETDERPRAVELPVQSSGRSSAGKRCRVLDCAGPWRLYGEWWGESRFARDYYDVELDDGGVYRLYHNAPDGAWFLDGTYD